MEFSYEKSFIFLDGEQVKTNNEWVMFKVNTVDLVIGLTTDFYNDLKIDENGRCRSWEYCYFHFMNARGMDNADLDYLSLQLAFYLASWGMYRGSSFLLQKDYKVHIPVVQELLNPMYDTLAGIKCVDLKRESNQKPLQNLNSFLTEYYDKIRRKVKGQELKSQVSDTLITKILMGTLGCVPAYDKYFIFGIKNQKVATGNYNINSVLRLVNFYESNVERLESVRKNMKIYNLSYPQMKMLDMGFWQIGFAFEQVRSFIQKTDIKNMSKNDIINSVPELGELHSEIAKEVLEQFTEFAGLKED